VTEVNIQQNSLNANLARQETYILDASI